MLRKDLSTGPVYSRCQGRLAAATVRASLFAGALAQIRVLMRPPPPSRCVCFHAAVGMSERPGESNSPRPRAEEEREHPDLDQDAGL